MTNKQKNINDILPEGLDESTVEAISELIDEAIVAQVEERVGLLEAKVTAFLRTKIDSLKEHAINELCEENETFRNAQLFESVRTLMALELNSTDERNAVTESKQDLSEVEEELEVMSEQYASVNQELSKQEDIITALQSQVNQLEEERNTLIGEKETLSEQVENLESVKDEEFLSSEAGKIITNESLNEENSEGEQPNLPPFITPEIMKHMVS